MASSEFVALRLSFSIAVMVLLVLVAAMLAFFPPYRADKRRLAAYLALTAASEVYFFQYTQPGTAAASLNAFSAFRIDALLLSWIALASLFWIFPSRVRLASWHGVVMVAVTTFFLVGLATFTFDRDALRRTALANVMLSEGVIVAHVLMLASVTARARARDPRERRATLLAALGACAWMFGLLGYFLLVGGFALTGDPRLLVSSLTRPPGDRFGIIPILVVVGYGGALAIAIAAARWTRFALGMIAFGFVVTLILYYGEHVDFFAVNWVVVALAPAYALTRAGAFGSQRFPRAVLFALALATFPTVFLLVILATIIAFGSSSLGLPIGIFLGLSASVYVTLVLVPRKVIRETLTNPSREAAASDPERYRVIRLLGQGGEGVTRLCYDEKLRREVVVKEVRPGLALREARAIAQVSHPNVLTVFDVDDRRIVMEFAPSGSLRDLLSRRSDGMAAREAAIYLDQVLAALDACHRAGIAHGDLKPENVLLAADGAVKVADFGIARRLGPDATLPAGAFGGTLDYMSPERLGGGPPSPAGDVYAAGVLTRALLGAHLAEAPALADVIARATAPDPADRFPSASAMRDALRE